MPIYEYICTRCKKNFEIFQKITDKPKKRCGECNGNLEKIVSQSSFLLKGSGWYKTDYAKKIKKEPEPSNSLPTSKECSGGQCQSSASTQPSSQRAGK
jgi:putative FmdB family regulatory protein